MIQGYNVKGSVLVFPLLLFYDFCTTLNAKLLPYAVPVTNAPSVAKDYDPITLSAEDLTPVLSKASKNNVVETSVKRVPSIT